MRTNVNTDVFLIIYWQDREHICRTNANLAVADCKGHHKIFSVSSNTQ